jgi:hypothetical protein
MNKITIIISIAAGVFCAVLSVMGADIFDAAYKIVIIAALLFTCSRVFAGAVKRGGESPLLAGALGLGLLLVSEVYSFAYIYLLKGGAEDITVSNYSRPCAYLFFLLALLSLMKNAKALRMAASVIATAAMGVIFYAVIADRPLLLYNSALSVAILCVLPAVCLLVQAKEAKAIACSILALCGLDIVNRLLILFDPGWHWHDMAVVLYPVVYIWIGRAMLGLRRIDAAESEVKDIG